MGGAVLDRFEAKYEAIMDDRGCLEWTAALTDGYGSFWTGERLVRAHRFSYESYVGDIPVGLFACHRCDNRSCVNPKHLFLDTNAGNMRDCSNKGRIVNQFQGKTNCSKGHEYTEENTKRYVQKGKGIQRVCVTCRDLTGRKHSEQKRVAS